MASSYPDVAKQVPAKPQGEVVDMEEEFLNLGLDIIGLGVFNYDFGSITRESPVIKVRPLSSCLLANIDTGTEDVVAL